MAEAHTRPPWESQLRQYPRPEAHRVHPEGRGPRFLHRRSGEQPHSSTPDRRLARVSQELRGRATDSLEAARRVATQVREHPLESGLQAAARSREMRLATEAHNEKRGRFKRFMSSAVGKGVQTAIEMIPSPVGYGPGDIATALSGVIGKNVLSGEKLDGVDRAIHIIAAAIPGVPATPFVEAARRIRKRTEDSIHRVDQARQQVRSPHYPSQPSREYPPYPQPPKGNPWQ